ncbi:CHAT domain-containing protein [Muricauda sp. TY007]|uniref:CHAT domain-containing protein n=1 Tax=Allomuricauda sp. TY007 TaxID=2683200 RepID=UPI0013BF95AF|nr:CHAT domain-containing protein [Muricauda sp. TY007]NDV14676.1 CHAT domain-containing protein [Muricauda sp. TY007]
MKKPLLLLMCIFAECAFAFQNDLSEKIQEADSLLKEQAYQLSKDHWKEIVGLTTQNKVEYHTYRSKLLFCEASLFQADGNYKSAIEKYQNALQLIDRDTAPKDNQYRLNIYNGLYHSLAYSGDWQAALEKGTEGLTLMDSTIEKKSRADYIYDLGYINDRLDNFTEAIELYQQSIELYKTFEESKDFDLGLAYNNLATVYRRIGFFSERLKSFEQAKIHWERDSGIDPTYLITLYGNMMKLYIEYGDTAKAEKLFDALNKVPDDALQTSDVFNKSRLNMMYCTFSGQSVKAKKQLDGFSALFATSNQKEKEQNSHYYLAALLDYADHAIQNGWDDRASQTLIQTLDIAKTYQQPYYEMLAYTKQTKLATLEKEYARAIDFLDEALAINDQEPIGQVNVVNILIKKGTLQSKLNHVLEAQSTIERALSVLTEGEADSPEEVTMDIFEQRHSSYFVMALKDVAGFYKETFLRTQDRTDAQHAKYLYVMAAEVFGLYYQNGEYNASLNDLNKEINEGIYEVHTTLSIPLSPTILAKMEANNSQVLRNEFERKYFRFLSVEESMLDRRNLLQFQLKNTGQDNEARKELREAISKLDAEIYDKDPLLQSFYNKQISLQDIQGHLTGNELLVKYFLGNERIFAMTISQDSLQLYRLAQTDSLKTKLTAFYQNLQNPQKNTRPLAQELYQELVEPFQDELGKYRNLTIIPDDFLHYLPFEVLENGEEPLVNSYGIQYANSLALWYFLKENPHRPKEHQDLLAAFAPQYETGDDGMTMRGVRFRDIKGAKKEAEKISAALDGDLFLDDEASVKNFMDHANKYKIYHLAMHAVLDEEEHTRSSLIFQNNDFFDFSSLYGMYLPAELVVLSACNTGVGKLAAGEGFLSLSRALTYSGVRSSVYSLWEVPDKETSEIMVSFYHYLDEGKNKATALAKAKQDFIENNPLRLHPYYWAGFIVNGDTAPIATSPKNWSWYIVAGVLMIGGIFYFIRFRRKGSVQLF